MQGQIEQSSPDLQEYWKHLQLLILPNSTHQHYKSLTNFVGHCPIHKKGAMLQEMTQIIKGKAHLELSQSDTLSVALLDYGMDKMGEDLPIETINHRIGQLLALKQSQARDKLLAVYYVVQGYFYDLHGEEDQIVLDAYTNALLFNPEYGPAYYNRALKWDTMDFAIRSTIDARRAFEIDPSIGYLYLSRYTESRKQLRRRNERV